MTPQQRQRRRGLVELLLGTVCLILSVTAAAGEAPDYVVPVTAMATVFMFGAAYADIRSSARAAHRRLDEKLAADRAAAEKLDGTLDRLSTEVMNLRLTLASRGMGQEDGS